MAGTGNLFALPALTGDGERFDTLLSGDGVRIERILSTGQTTPPGQWYDQQDDEWVVLLQGEAEIGFDDGSRRRLAAGDPLFIPAHQRHRVEYTSATPPCIWLAVHLPAGLTRPPPQTP